MFFGDCETNAGISQRVQTTKYGYMHRAGLLGLLENKSEIVGS